MTNINNLEVNNLIEYYLKKGGITLVGLNDSQLINVINPYSKGSFDLLVNTFKKHNVPTTSINIGSSFYNKAEHAQAIIEEDLTITEIYLLNSYSFLAAYSKVLSDLGLPFELPNAFERLIRPSFDIKNAENRRLSDFLSQQPVIITSFVANNFMRAVANNPWAIVKDYKNKDKTINYNYTLSKIQDKKVLEGIIELTKRTYDTILSRTNGNIYGIGFFLPNGMVKEEGLRIFSEFVDIYNDAYSNLCKTLGVNYVDVSALGRTTGDINFHASPEQIRNSIIREMCRNIPIGNDLRNNCIIIQSKGNGLTGMKNRAQTASSIAEKELSDNPNDKALKNTRRERNIELKIVERANTAYIKIKK